MKQLITLIFILHISQISAQKEGNLLGHWENPDLVPSAIHDNTYNEVWGIFVNNHEIAVIGSTEGTHFVDVTDPLNPEEVQFVEGGSTGPVIIHRDYHDYNGYLYAVADEGNFSTLQIIDISKLPNEIEVVYDSKEYIRRTHNIFIDSSAARMYACITNGDDVNRAGLRIFDISSPFQPLVLASYDFIDGFNVSGLHDIYVEENIGYLNSGTVGFAIVDFTNVTDPVVLGSLFTTEYPESGYNHSGWLTEDGNIYVMADETFGMRMKVLDVSNPSDIEVLSLLSSDSGNAAEIPHNQLIKGDYLYVSYYYDGLQVYNISDPENVERVLFYDTSTIPHTSGLYRGAWGVYPFLPSGNVLVSDMQNGLFIIENIEKTLVNNDNLEFPSKFEVFPNPTEGIINLNFDSDLIDSNLELSIIDLNGKIIYQQKNVLNSNLKINSNLSQGMYFIELKNRSLQMTRKLIVK